MYVFFRTAIEILFKHDRNWNYLTLQLIRVGWHPLLEILALPCRVHLAQPTETQEAEHVSAKHVPSGTAAT